MNLLQETKRDIKSFGYVPEEIIFIGSEASGHSCTWKQFTELANIEYDAGFGGQEVACDLIIVFSDKTVMRRREYDGSEWWSYNKQFEMPKEKKKIRTLVRGEYESMLYEMNREGGNYGEDE